MVSCINGILFRFIGFSSPVFKSRKLLLLHFLQPEKIEMFELLEARLTEFFRMALCTAVRVCGCSFT